MVFGGDQISELTYCCIDLMRVFGVCNFWMCLCDLLDLLLLAASHDPTIEVSDSIVDDDYRQKLLRLL